jgi:hypothetical protein
MYVIDNIKNPWHMGVNVKRHVLEPIFKITFLNKEIFIKIFFIGTIFQTTSDDEI